MKETQVAVVVTLADARSKRAELEHAWHMMRSYLVDCAAQKEATSKRRTEELNGVIGACIERLALDRRHCGFVSDAQLPLDALDYALLFVDEHIDARLKWDRLASKSASVRRFAHSTGTASRESVISRVRRITTRLHGGTMNLAQVTLEIGRSCQSHLARWFRQRSGMAVGYARIRNEQS